MTPYFYIAFYIAESNHQIAHLDIKHCGKEIELNKIYNYPTIENIGLLCFMMAGALILMKKFIPDLVEIYNIFEELDLSCISSIDNLKGKKIIKRDGGWGQI